MCANAEWFLPGKFETDFRGYSDGRTSKSLYKPIEMCFSEMPVNFALWSIAMLRTFVWHFASRRIKGFMEAYVYDFLLRYTMWKNNKNVNCLKESYVSSLADMVIWWSSIGEKDIQVKWPNGINLTMNSSYADLLCKLNILIALYWISVQPKCSVAK